MSATKEIKSGVTEIALNANIYREDDQYIAQCVELGTVSQDDTPEAAISSLKDAVELYLSEFPNALNNPKKRPTDLVERVRAFERTYAASIGESVQSSEISLIGTASFTISFDHA